MTPKLICPLKDFKPHECTWAEVGQGFGVQGRMLLSEMSVAVAGTVGKMHFGIGATGRGNLGIRVNSVSARVFFQSGQRLAYGGNFANVPPRCPGPPGGSKSLGGG